MNMDDRQRAISAGVLLEARVHLELVRAGAGCSCVADCVRARKAVSWAPALLPSIVYSVLPDRVARVELRLAHLGGERC